MMESKLSQAQERGTLWFNFEQPLIELMNYCLLSHHQVHKLFNAQPDDGHRISRDTFIRTNEPNAIASLHRVGGELGYPPGTVTEAIRNAVTYFVANNPDLHITPQQFPTVVAFRPSPK